jgi:hypothetical protein
MADLEVRVETYKAPKPSSMDTPSFFLVPIVMFHTIMQGSTASMTSVATSKALTVCSTANAL